jgi:hypothetical protein
LAAVLSHLALSFRGSEGEEIRVGAAGD